MRGTESVASELKGLYRDVLRDARGGVVRDSGWHPNVIVADCRRLLAAFLHGSPATALGIQGLQVGAGLPAWDLTGTPAPDPSQTVLVDPQPFTVPLASLKMDFLQGATVTTTPTNRLQIVATLGPNMPPWPDATHSSSTLREFGLVGQLNGQPVLLNCVRHPAITKDPFSSLDRTIWLVF